jgi:ADP-ribose pyrophosphatase
MKLNLAIVYNKEEDKILMCYRSKDPYKGLYNLVGGKLEENEDSDTAAYRELEEETGITKEDIILTHVMDFYYYTSDTELQVYAGKLNKDVEVVEEANKLFWFDVTEDFFALDKFAGEGNIGHMLEQVMLHKDDILK